MPRRGRRRMVGRAALLEQQDREQELRDLLRELRREREQQDEPVAVVEVDVEATER